MAIQRQRDGDHRRLFTVVGYVILTSRRNNNSRNKMWSSKVLDKMFEYEKVAVKLFWFSTFFKFFSYDLQWWVETRDLKKKENCVPYYMESIT